MVLINFETVCSIKEITSSDELVVVVNFVNGMHKTFGGKEAKDISEIARSLVMESPTTGWHYIGK